MNEITRIHIAKIPYEIEIPAKKQLETYLSSLRDYINDSEVVNDIEIRMTEILHERDIKPDGVVGLDDVTAIQEQIGSPEEIADDSGEAGVGGQVVGRKLYRDTDYGLIGGVIAGAAAYFRIDRTLARIVFVILALFTSGAALLVYAVMWLLVPAAKTTADRLRMHGKPVTIESMQTVNSQDTSQARLRGQTIRTIILYMVGLVAVLGAIGSLVLIGAAIVSVYSEGIMVDEYDSSVWHVAFGLMVVSGLLLATLLTLVAYACFRQELPRRLVVAGVAIIAAGLISFTAAVGTGIYGSWQQQTRIEDSLNQRSIAPPRGFSEVDSIAVKSGIPLVVEYEVSDQYRVIYESTGDALPQIEVIDNQAEISLEAGGGNFLAYMQPKLVIYGPSVKQLYVDGNIDINYLAEDQESLQIVLGDYSGGSLTGKIDNLQLTTGKNGDYDLMGASIDDVSLDMAHNSDVRLGNIGTLSIKHSSACPATGDAASVRLAHLASEELRVNDEDQAIRSSSSPCLELVYGQDK